MFDLGVLLLIIMEFVFVCFILVMKEECVKVSKVLSGLNVVVFEGDKIELVEVICKVLYMSKICLYV